MRTLQDVQNQEEKLTLRDKIANMPVAKKAVIVIGFVGITYFAYKKFFVKKSIE
jgi:hypothetical protein